MGRIAVQMMNSGHERLASWGAGHIDPSDDDVVLDIGCGGGANVARWLSACPKGSVTGVDYSNVSVKKTRSFNRKAVNEGRCAVLQADVAQLPFEDGTFTLVSACETIYFWPGLEKCFAEVARVMKNGGIFLIIVEDDGEDENHTDWASRIEGMKVYTEAEVRSALESAGFGKVEAYHNENHWMTVVATK